MEGFLQRGFTVCAHLLCVQDIADLPEGASTPALGLSNKAVFQGMNPLNSLATGEFAVYWSWE